MHQLTSVPVLSSRPALCFATCFRTRTEKTSSVVTALKTLKMLENKAFLLKGILDTTFGERPIPECKPDWSRRGVDSEVSTTVTPDEVLVEIKKTGELHLLSTFRCDNKPSIGICGSDVSSRIHVLYDGFRTLMLLKC